MNGSDFDDVSIDGPPIHYEWSNTYLSQQQPEVLQTSMNQLEAWPESPGGYAKLVQAGSPDSSTTRCSDHTSSNENHDGCCKRKNRFEKDSLSDVDHGRHRKTKHSKAPSDIKYACPFYKNDPTRFTRRQACSGPGFASISRVKEHLYRAHKPEYQCIRCYSTFATRDSLERHQRAKEPCEISTYNSSDGISEAQCIRLRRKPSGQKTVVERWEEIYRIIFPKAHCVPSCYYESRDKPSTATTYSQGLKNVESTLIAGVREDLDKCFDKIEKDVKLDLIQMIGKQLEIAMQELVAKNAETTPTDMSALAPYESQVNCDAGSLDLSSNVGFDFDSWQSIHEATGDFEFQSEADMLYLGLGSGTSLVSQAQ